MSISKEAEVSISSIHEVFRVRVNQSSFSKHHRYSLCRNHIARLSFSRNLRFFNLSSFRLNRFSANRRVCTNEDQLIPRIFNSLCHNK